MSGHSDASTQTAVEQAVVRLKPAREMHAPVSMWVTGSTYSFAACFVAIALPTRL